ncbi:MAG: imidazole glycerol phosphate synthase subunit HisH [Nitrospirae bacterium]|nr:MAG: imidazole glycerol phosphate synthase subunit HisH [Nitrospirota bacterium]
MIAIVDCEMGNLRSVQKAFEAVGYMAVITQDPSIIEQASHVVLPGVGAFGDYMAALHRLGLIAPLYRFIQSGKPFLGICLGLQVLFAHSEEFGIHPGLNILKGTVRRLTPSSNTSQPLKIPHMGWNTIHAKTSCPLLAGIPSGAYMYFVHSYYVDPEDLSVICTETTYGRPFVSSIWQENIFATQFHPEKSQAVGLQLLRNFGAWR